LVCYEGSYWQPALNKKQETRNKIDVKGKGIPVFNLAPRHEDI